MPPKQRSGSHKRKMPPKDTDEYKTRRERNNAAVKKSRQKTREKAKHTMTKINKLKEENERLEQQVQILSKELGVLKDLFHMAHAGSGNFSGVCTSQSNAGTQASIQTDGESATESVDEPEDNKDIIMPKADDYDEKTVVVNQEALQKDHEYSAPRPKA